MSYVAFHIAVNWLSRQAILWYTGRQSKLPAVQSSAFRLVLYQAS